MALEEQDYLLKINSELEVLSQREKWDDWCLKKIRFHFHISDLYDFMPKNSKSTVNKLNSQEQEVLLNQAQNQLNVFLDPITFPNFTLYLNTIETELSNPQNPIIQKIQQMDPLSEEINQEFLTILEEKELLELNKALIYALLEVERKKLLEDYNKEYLPLFETEKDTIPDCQPKHSTHSRNQIFHYAKPEPTTPQRPIRRVPLTAEEETQDKDDEQLRLALALSLSLTSPRSRAISPRKSPLKNFHNFGRAADNPLSPNFNMQNKRISMEYEIDNYATEYPTSPSSPVINKSLNPISEFNEKQNKQLSPQLLKKEHPVPYKIQRPEIRSPKKTVYTLQKNAKTQFFKPTIQIPTTKGIDSTIVPLNEDPLLQLTISSSDPAKILPPDPASQNIPLTSPKNENPRIVETKNFIAIRNAVIIGVAKYYAWSKGEQSHRGANGFFSWLRHGKDGRIRALKLKKYFENPMSESNAISYLNEQLCHPLFRDEKHSLLSFLLDELRKLENLPWVDIKPDPITNRYNKEDIRAHVNVFLPTATIVTALK